MEGPDCNVASTEVNDYSWTELQHAMGATDEEMAILQNFGSNSSEEGQNVTNENCLDLLDMDCREDTNSNQVNKLYLCILYKFNKVTNPNIYYRRNKQILKSIVN